MDLWSVSAFQTWREMGLVGLTLWVVESQIAGVTSQEGTCLEEHWIRKGFHLFCLFGEFGGCVFVGVLWLVCLFFPQVEIFFSFPFFSICPRTPDQSHSQKLLFSVSRVAHAPQMRN